MRGRCLRKDRSTRFQKKCCPTRRFCKKFYFKIVLWFLAALLITMALTGVIFTATVGKAFVDTVVDFARSQAMMVRDLTQEVVKLDPDIAPADNENLQWLIKRVAETYKAKTWLVDSENRVVAKSFPGGIPPLGHTDECYSPLDGTLAGGEFSQCGHDPEQWLFTLPLDLGHFGRGTLWMVLSHPKEHEPHKHFFMGMIGICLVVGLLAVPVSRTVTRPVGRLRESVGRIASGDLSHRAEIIGRDELGALADDVNHMADSLQSLILAGRELLANVSHELRSPLARLRVAQELVQEQIEKDCDPENFPHLNAMREEIGSLDSLIGWLLLYARMEAGGTALRFEPLHVSELLDGLLIRMAPILEKNELKLTANLGGEPRVRADAQALNSAFMNLLDNAAKYTTPGGAIEVTARRNGGRVEVLVSNTHPPLSDEELENLFKPFVRGRTSASGTGLGLAITRQAILAHKGSIKAENTDTGVLVTVSLPLGGEEAA